LLLTNAAGGINESFKAGDMMVITDHINLPHLNPLTGPNLDEFGPRFCDMTFTYSKKFNDILLDGATRIGIDIRQGVYCLWSGPSYETPAEIRMIRVIGADAVGMSTVPEAIAANHAGIETAGISCITNMAAGMSGKRLSHEEVLEAGAHTSVVAKKLIDYFVSKV